MNNLNLTKNSNCNFCVAFKKKSGNIELPFRDLCENHDKLVKNNPDFVKLNQQAHSIIKPLPKLHFGKGGYGKIRFKSYLKDLPGTSPLTWWDIEESSNEAHSKLKNMVESEKPNLDKKVPKRKRIKKNNHCVCSYISEISILFGSKIEGEMFFKHSVKCESKVLGNYKWTGVGFEAYEPKTYE